MSREAELAKLRLVQQRQQKELERQRQDIERQLKEAALAQEVERLEFKAELLEQEEGEVGEGGGDRDGHGDSGAQPSVADRQRPSGAAQPLSRSVLREQRQTVPAAGSTTMKAGLLHLRDKRPITGLTASTFQW